MKKAPFGSFFVYRHLGLAGCNISYRGYWNWNC